MTGVRDLPAPARLGVAAAVAAVAHLGVLLLLALTTRATAVARPPDSITVELAEVSPVRVAPRAAPTSPPPAPAAAPRATSRPVAQPAVTPRTTTPAETRVSTPDLAVTRPAAPTTSPAPATTVPVPEEPGGSAGSGGGGIPLAATTPGPDTGTAGAAGTGSRTGAAVTTGGSAPAEVVQTAEELLADLLGARPAARGGEPVVTGEAARLGGGGAGAVGTSVPRGGSGEAGGGGSTVGDALARLSTPGGGSGGGTPGASGSGSGTASTGGGSGPEDGRVAWAPGTARRGVLAAREPDLTGVRVETRTVVEVQITVTAAGVVRSAVVVRGATPEIEAAVLRAVRVWSFAPSPGAPDAEAVVSVTVQPRR